jgi:hypothetical protein
MKAILVKTLPATNTKGLRYKAVCGLYSVTVDASSCVDYKVKMTIAAKLLADKLGWTGNYYGATLNSDCMVFVPKNDIYCF